MVDQRLDSGSEVAADQLQKCMDRRGILPTLIHCCPDRPVRIMSADQVYYQLLDGDWVRIINRSRKGPSASSPTPRCSALRRHSGWPDYRAMSGDASGNLPGVAGVGAKTAQDWLAGVRSFEDLPVSGRLTGAKGAAMTASGLTGSGGGS